MKLSVMVTDLAKIPEAFRSLYEKQDDGSFILGIEDSEYKAKLGEFRDNNRVLKQKAAELEAAMAKYKDVDPAKYAEAMTALEKINQLEEAELLKKGDLEGVVKKRVAVMQADYENRLKQLNTSLQGLQGERDTYKGQLGNLLIDDMVTKAIDAAGYRPRQGAITDIKLRARTTWALDEQGKVVPKQGNGETVYGPKGQPLTPDEWAAGLVKDAAYLFEPAKGSGGAGQDKGGTGGQTKVIDARDNDAMVANLKDIAAGKVQAVAGGGQQ